MEIKKWVNKNGKEVGIYALTMGSLASANAAMGLGMGLSMAEYYAGVYNNPELGRMITIVAAETGATLGAALGTVEGLFWLKVGGMAYDHARFRITPEKMDRWAENSIDTAGEMDILDGKTLESLEDVELKVNKDKRPQNVFYGRAYHEKSVIEVYHKNLSQKKNRVPKVLKKADLPKKEITSVRKMLYDIPKKEFYEIYNQSFMDRGIIGHIGNYRAGKAFGEHTAFMTQKVMAEYRSRENKEWEIMAGLVPVVEKVKLCHG